MIFRPFLRFEAFIAKVTDGLPPQPAMMAETVRANQGRA